MDYSKNATITKIKAIYGKRLKSDNYKELASKKTVSDAAEYLKKNTRYSSALENINPVNVHRGLLEDTIKKSFFETYVKLCKFQNLDKLPFFNFLILRLEIDEILNVILHLNADSADDYIIDLPAFLLNMTSLDLLNLAKARSFIQLLDALKHTQYYAVLKDMPLDRSGKPDLAKCETTLRTHYLKWMLDAAEKNFIGDAKKNLVLQIQTQIDLINIINIYRMKFNFSASPEKTNSLILPFCGRMRKSRLDKLINAPDTDSFLRSLSVTIYGRMLAEPLNIADSISFERQLEKLRFNMAKRALMFSDNAALSLYSVTSLFEVELRNIVKIIEGIRYNKSAGYIESLLVLE